MNLYNINIDDILIHKKNMEVVKIGALNINTDYSIVINIVTNLAYYCDDNYLYDLRYLTEFEEILYL